MDIPQRQELEHMIRFSTSVYVSINDPVPVSQESAGNASRQRRQVCACTKTQRCITSLRILHNGHRHLHDGPLRNLLMDDNFGHTWARARLGCITPLRILHNGHRHLHDGPLRNLLMDDNFWHTWTRAQRGCITPLRILHNRHIHPHNRPLRNLYNGRQLLASQ